MPEFLKALAARRRKGRRARAHRDRQPRGRALGARRPRGWSSGLLASLPGGDPAVNEAIIRGLARGWPKDKPARLDKAGEAALKRLAVELTPAARGQLVRLAGLWGNQASTSWARRSPGRCWRGRNASSPSRPAWSRAGARRAASFRRLGLAAVARIDQLGRLARARRRPARRRRQSKAPGVGAALAETLPRLRPRERSRALRIMLGRSDWSPALVDALERGQAKISELALDQKQALSTHPDRKSPNEPSVARARAAACPTPTARKCSTASRRLLKEGGDTARGKVVFQEQCSKCHRYGDDRRPGRPRLDRHGRRSRESSS